MSIVILPEPSRQHAMCAWCEESFSSIVALLDHVDSNHLPRANDVVSRPAPTIGLAA
jgi:hypothetical protein